MIEKNDLQTIKIIQGDTLTAVFTVEDIVLEDISAATFVCRDLDLEVELIPANAYQPEEGSADSSSWEDYNDNSIPDKRWYLWYTGDTNELRPGVFTYDFTIYLDQADQVFTLIYHGKLIIQPRNPQEFYNPYYEYPHNTKREH